MEHGLNMHSTRFTIFNSAKTPAHLKHGSGTAAVLDNSIQGAYNIYIVFTKRKTCVYQLKT